MLEASADILTAFVQFLPLYIGLCLVPGIIRGVVESVVLGINSEYFSSVSYAEGFRSFVISVFFAPFFEELLFRALPLLVFGFPGLVVATVTWILLHPAWQLQYIDFLPLKKKLAFTFTSTTYYACCALFYVTVWLSGAGLAAVLYHMFHNFIFTSASILKEALPEIKLRKPTVRLGIRRTKFVRAKGDKGREVAPTTSFVSKKRGASENEAKEFIYVRRKSKSRAE